MGDIPEQKQGVGESGLWGYCARWWVDTVPRECGGQAGPSWASSATAGVAQGREGTGVSSGQLPAS